MKTAKFAEVVKKCGEPSVYLAWVEPARDKTLKRALAEHRVMTLHQELHGGKKDFGSVGLLKDRHAQLLVFPKSLRRFSDRKIIAIDYSLIAKDPSGTDTTAPDVTNRKKRPVHAQPAVRPPPTRKAEIEEPKPKLTAQQK